jgi:Tfp pilus assembly protein PilW
MMRSPRHPLRSETGLTMVELMVSITILAVVFSILMTTFLSSGRLYDRTTRRAEIQMSSRDGMSLMMTEVRQAGADPANPPIGLAGIATADAQTIRVRADLNGDGALQTTEPSEDVTYSYNGTQRAILRNPGSGARVVVPNVTAMTLSYRDASGTVLGPLPLTAANAALVRTVELTLTSDNRDTEPITLTSRIALRNL